MSVNWIVSTSSFFQEELLSLYLSSSLYAVSLTQHFVDIGPLHSGRQAVGGPNFLIFLGDLSFLPE